MNQLGAFVSAGHEPVHHPLSETDLAGRHLFRALLGQPVDSNCPTKGPEA